MIIKKMIKNKILQIGILGQIKIILPFVPMSVRITNPIERRTEGIRDRVSALTPLTSELVKPD